ncbi:uncharacterized protein I303_104489 [Kwoniella dejecticola CBS 10117]|uniref:Uncharacterized protein n=1 Tax=Kwoniella dejecticola CBS 10117 TaxID=1296121 RepID=A0A1A6A581_9TREE|nr:uncharacterized protein I303_04533 [Kwoniella dejecticola CBS 10117]OBR85201.1 hypothetical protein I303_04533 [Kwoniella dejecticola CBS 10117]
MTTLSRNPSTYTNSSFLNNVYLDPKCSIPESPTLSLDSSSPFNSDMTTSTSERTELSRIVSNDESGEYEDLEDSQVCLRRSQYAPLSAVGGGTKPLRVKKKKGVTAVKVGHSSKARKRRSTLSFPHSPSPRESYSPRTHHTGVLSANSGPKRNMSTTSNQSSISRTHANISRLFLSLPNISSPSPTGEHTSFASNETMRRERIFSDSSLHLGLGKFEAYDPMVKPGPSPPISPQPSPIKRSFVSPSTPERKMVVDEYRKKALPNPPSPLTPSRAPRKAAALLGAATINQKSTSHGGGKSKVHGLNTKHFRPLPNSTLTEIERFFGDLPKKASKTPPGLKQRSSPRTQADANAPSQVVTAERGVGDRNVGGGETVKHQAEDGSMWLDVEEEQEFAWLLSEIFALHPQPLPDLARIRSHGSTSEPEDRWEMETFTSILSLPKPKTTKTATPKSSNAKGVRNGKDNSFSDLETPRPLTLRGSPKHDFEASPWSIKRSGENAKPKHQRSVSNPISPTIDKISISPPMPTLIPPPRVSSKPNTHANANANVGLSSSVPSSTTKYIASASENESTSALESGFSSDSSCSENEKHPSPSGKNKKTKTRPPPLTLKRIKPSGKLPILTATSPQHGVSQSRSQPQSREGPSIARDPPRPIIAQSPQHHRSRSKATVHVSDKYDAPDTPFVKPRSAPRPNSKPTTVGRSIPPVPPLPKAIPICNPSSIPLPVSRERQREEPMSFFEPITPTQPVSQSRMGLSKKATEGVGREREKKSWLKRVVKSVKA